MHTMNPTAAVRRMMGASPVVRRLTESINFTIEREVCRFFPIATEPGSFLSDPLPVELRRLHRAGRPTMATPGWQLVTSDQYGEPAHVEWCRELKMEPRCFRKQWEWTYALEVLKQHGMLAPGKRGLGFGCGREPLSAIMAKHGASIVATDLADEEAVNSGWRTSGQYAARRDDLNADGLCDKALFRERAQFRHCNMNAIPDDLNGFDFLWSSCALEHLGSLEHGLRFIENAMRCLRPGGIAVHTTEFNLGSNDRTVDRPSVSIYRKRDIEGLAVRLLRLGHELPTINFTTGTGPHDKYVDLPPYHSPIHLRLLAKRHLSTSIGLYVKRGPAA